MQQSLHACDQVPPQVGAGLQVRAWLESKGCTQGGAGLAMPHLSRTKRAGTQSDRGDSRKLAEVLGVHSAEFYGAMVSE